MEVTEKFTGPWTLTLLPKGCYSGKVKSTRVVQYQSRYFFGTALICHLHIMLLNSCCLQVHCINDHTHCQPRKHQQRFTGRQLMVQVLIWQEGQAKKWASRCWKAGQWSGSVTLWRRTAGRTEKENCCRDLESGWRLKQWSGFQSVTGNSSSLLYFSGTDPTVKLVGWAFYFSIYMSENTQCVWAGYIVVVHRHILYIHV